MVLKRISIVIVLTLAFSFGIGKYFDLNFTRRWGVFFLNSADTLIKSTFDYDIIYIGDSRINFGINPYYIDSVLKTKSYNFGIGGGDLEYMSMVIKLYMQNHKMQPLVCIGVTDDTLIYNGFFETNYPYLMYSNNAIISEYMEKGGFPMRLIRIIPFLKYSYFNDYYRTSLFLKGNPIPKFDHNIYNGFINITENKNESKTKFDTQHEITEVDLNNIVKLESILSTLQIYGSKVLFIYLPRRNPKFIRSEYSLSYHNILKGFQQKFSIQSINFENDIRFSPSLFVDEVHLNGPGAKLLSLAVADSLKKVFEQNNR